MSGSNTAPSTCSSERACVPPPPPPTVLIDHWKDRYLPDAQHLLGTGLLAPGAVVFADNIIFPGAPAYATWIRAHPQFTSVYHQSHLEYSSTVIDGVEVSTFKGYD